MDSRVVYGTWVIAFAGFVAFASGEQVYSRQKRVIGGTTVNKGDRPWLVSLTGKIVTERLWGIIPIKHRTVHCGGSLLDDQWVITAAHCFDGGVEARDVDAWEVRLAAVDLKVELADRFMNFIGEMFKIKKWMIWEVDVSRIVIHPDYNRQDMWFQDIALVKLEKRVPSGPQFEHIKRIKLPEAFDYNFPTIGSVCQVSGWGCTAAGGGISRRAMSVNLPILRNSICHTYYRPRNMIGRICAGYDPDTEGAGICSGDSGGPLVCQDENNEWIQVGVASFTSRDNPEKFPAVFARVSDFVHWIHLYVNPTD